MKPCVTSPPASRLICKPWARAILLCAILISGLTSCATGTAPTTAPVTIPVTPPPALPANLTQTCPPLPAAQASTALAILAAHDREAALYHECRSMNARLLEAVEEWRATAWRWYCATAARIEQTPDNCGGHD